MGWEKGGVLQTFSSDFAQPKWAGPANIGRKSGYARSAFIGGSQTALPSSFTPSGLTMNITTPLVWLT